MYIAIRQKGTDIILDQATFSTQNTNFETLEKALKEVESDINDFMKYANETYEDYYIQQID